MEKVFISRSEEDTGELAEKLAALSVQGDIWALNGTLGAGKSVFARAFIKKLTGAREVPSPTFTLLQTYEAPDFDIYHFDLYRLKSPDEIFEIGVEDALYSGVSLIEWPDKMSPYLPRDIFKLEIVPQSNGRKLTITINSAEKQSRLAALEG